MASITRPGFKLFYLHCMKKKLSILYTEALHLRFLKSGGMAGTSVAAGVLVPTVSSIPYIGWLASGWALLLGQNIGSAAGSQVNSFISDC